MGYLLLNGYALKVSETRGETVEIGNRDRAFSGIYRSSIRARKRSWSLTTPPMIRSEVEAISGLLQGLGHYWPFDSDLYSSKGLPPSAGYAASIEPTGGLYGGRAVVSGTLSYPAGLGDDWTVIVARLETTWHRYAVRSDGAKWVDGARNDGATTSWLTVSGAVTLGAGTYDELVALPYLALDQQIVAWHALTVPFAPLPRLHATGDLARRPAEDPLLVEAHGLQYRAVPHARDGLWQKDGMSLEFTLEEV